MVNCAESYEVEYKPASSADWMLVSTTDNYLLINDLLPSINYEWVIKTKCLSIPETYSEYADVQTFSTIPTLIEDGLFINNLNIYPNPFSSDATIEFTLTQNSQIEIVLEEITGRTLKILLNDVINAGNHKTILNKYTLSAGMYVLRLSSEHDSISRKIIIE